MKTYGFCIYIRRFKNGSEMRLWHFFRKQDSPISPYEYIIDPWNRTRVRVNEFRRVWVRSMDSKNAVYVLFGPVESHFLKDHLLSVITSPNLWS